MPWYPFNNVWVWSVALRAANNNSFHNTVGITASLSYTQNHYHVSISDTVGITGHLPQSQRFENEVGIEGSLGRLRTGVMAYEIEADDTSPHSGQWTKLLTGTAATKSFGNDIMLVGAETWGLGLHVGYPNGYTAGYQGFIAIDTSDIPVQLQSVLTLRLNFASNADQWTMYVAPYTGAVPLTSNTQWLTQTQLAALTPVGSVDAQDLANLSAGGGGNFPIPLDPAAINPGGITKLVFYTDHMVTGVALDDTFFDFAYAVFDAVITLEFPTPTPLADTVGITAKLGSNRPGFQNTVGITGTFSYTYIAHDNFASPHDTVGITAVLSVPFTYKDAVRNAGPVLYWRLGEPNGAGTAVDASGNGRNGTYEQGPTGGMAGFTGDGDTAVYFYGLDSAADWQRVETAPWGVPQVYTACTFEFIMQPQPYPGNWFGGIATIGNENTNTYVEIYMYNSHRRLEFDVQTDANDFAFVQTANDFISFDTVYHVVGTFDGTNVKLYVNGILKGSDTLPTGQFTITSVDQIFAGNDPYFGGDGWNGILDEFAFYDRALSPTEVSDHFALVSTTPHGYPLRGFHNTVGIEGFLTVLLNPPTITSISPTSAAEGSVSVTILGHYLDQVYQVLFGTVPALSFTIVDSHTIIAMAPNEGSGLVHVTVTSASGTSISTSADVFTYTGSAPPTTFTPASFSGNIAGTAHEKTTKVIPLKASEAPADSTSALRSLQAASGKASPRLLSSPEFTAMSINSVKTISLDTGKQEVTSTLRGPISILANPQPIEYPVWPANYVANFPFHNSDYGIYVLQDPLGPGVTPINQQSGNHPTTVAPGTLDPLVWTSQGRGYSFDSFIRGNSTTLGESDGGGTLDPLAWTSIEGAVGINGNKAIAEAIAGTTPNPVGAATGDAIAVQQLGTADVDINATITMGAANAAVGIVFRVTDVSNYWYFERSTTTSPQVTKSGLFKRVAGVWTQVGAFFPQTFGSGENTDAVMRVVANGSSIKVYRNGTLEISTTDAFNSTATKHGIRFDAFHNCQVSSWGIRPVDSTVGPGSWGIENGVTPGGVTGYAVSHSSFNVATVDLGSADVDINIWHRGNYQAGVGAGLVLRYVDPLNFYLLVGQFTGDGFGHGYTLSIYEVRNGVYNQIYSNTNGGAYYDSFGDNRFRIKANGNSIFFYVNGVEYLRRTDFLAASLTATRHGIFRDGNDAAPNEAQLDNWCAYDLNGVVLSSDSFNRPNSASLGSTDGAGEVLTSFGHWIGLYKILPAPLLPTGLSIKIFPPSAGAGTSGGQYSSSGAIVPNTSLSDTVFLFSEKVHRIDSYFTFDPGYSEIALRVLTRVGDTIVLSGTQMIEKAWGSFTAGGATDEGTIVRVDDTSFAWAFATGTVNPTGPWGTGGGFPPVGDETTIFGLTVSGGVISIASTSKIVNADIPTIVDAGRGGTAYLPSNSYGAQLFHFYNNKLIGWGNTGYIFDDQVVCILDWTVTGGLNRGIAKPIKTDSLHDLGWGGFNTTIGPGLEGTPYIRGGTLSGIIAYAIGGHTLLFQNYLDNFYDHSQPIFYGLPPYYFYPRQGLSLNPSVAIGFEYSFYAADGIGGITYAQTSQSGTQYTNDVLPTTLFTYDELAPFLPSPLPPMNSFRHREKLMMIGTIPFLIP